jgi:transcription initiation factor TFIIB
MNVCPECGSVKIAYIESKAEVVCKDCGLVVDDFGFERNPYLGEGKKKSAKLPLMIKAGTAPINGKIVKHSWLLSTREKNIKMAESRIRLIASKLRLTETVTNEAMYIFRLAVENNLNVGRDNISLAYGSMYLACMIHGIPKTPLEITMYSEISRKKMLRAYILLKKKLKLEVKPVEALDYVPRFASRLRLNQKTVTKANEILIKMKGHPVTYGKHPETLVASAIYLASQMTGEEITQRAVANATGVIEVTIRKRSKEIVNELEF